MVALSAGETFMRRALELARRGKGRTAPNPAVGALIVKNGRIIAEGWHRQAGKPHAELEALRAARESVSGATMYVTLEPCNHMGRTGPCAQAIIAAGIREVAIGARDRSAKPGAKGAAALRRAGVIVRSGILRADCERMVEDFHKHSATGLPLVTLKAAVTLDGKIAARSWDSKWITSPASRAIVHRMRNESHAVMVGADTVMYDDPQLTVRVGPRRRDPLRVVVDGRLRIPLSAQVVKTARAVPTLIVTTRRAPARKIALLRAKGVEVETLGGRRVDLPRLMALLGQRGVMSLLVESGGALAAALLEQRLVDRAAFFIAPKIIGGARCAIPARGPHKMADAWRLEHVSFCPSNGDMIVEGKIAYR